MNILVKPKNAISTASATSCPFNGSTGCTLSCTYTPK